MLQLEPLRVCAPTLIGSPALLFAFLPTGTSGRFEIKDRFLPMGGRGGRGGGYGGGRGRGGGGYSLVLGDEEEERPRQVGREAGRQGGVYGWQLAIAPGRVVSHARLRSSALVSNRR